MTSELTVTTVAERPEYAERIYEVRDTFPHFMAHDKLANALFNQVASVFGEYSVIATAADGTPVARGRAIPFSTEPDGRELYPDGGWDSVLQWGFADHRAGRAPTAVSALEVAVDIDHLGRGLSHVMLSALREAVRAQGHDALIVPVRPTAKQSRPALPLTEYVAETRDDGLPTDPWLRVHVRAGGTIVRVCPAAMLVGGSLAQWRAWTGQPFDTDGDVIVDGALVPVHCDLTHDHAVYVEPNVWVRHDL